MIPLKYSVCGKGIRDRETALAVFWKTMETQNGNRRRKPQEFIKIDKVVHRDGEGWTVHYTVPNEVLEEKKTEDANLKYDGVSAPKPDSEPDAKSKSEIKGEPLQVPLSAISVSGLNPRKAFDPDGMESLKESIRINGILEPLILRPKGDTYELVLGERRFTAAKEIGLETVPAIVKDVEDGQVLEYMLTENILREDLNPIEEAEGIRRWMKSNEFVAQIAAERLGKSEAWLSKRLQLLDLPADLQELLLKGDLTPYHIEKLTPFAGFAVYTEIVRRMKDELKQRDTISVRTLEALIDGTIMSDFLADRSLNLNEFPHEYKDRRHYFEIKECLTCEKPGHVRFESEDLSLTDFCIDRPCYSDRLNKAKQKLEEERSRKPLQTTLIEIVEPSAEACDGCPAWDLRHRGCLEGHGNAANCPQHAAEEAEPVRKIRAEVPAGITWHSQIPTDIEEASGDISEKVPSLKTQKCHVLECTNETEPGSHWCKDHRMPESRKKAEEPMGAEDKGDPIERRVITRGQYALVRRASFLGPNDEKEPRFEELERAGRPAKDIVHRYKSIPKSNTAKRDLLKWCYPPLEEVDL